MVRATESVKTGGSRSGMLASAALGPQLQSLTQSAGRLKEAAAKTQAESNFRAGAAIGEGIGQIGQAATGAIQQKYQTESTEKMQDKQLAVQMDIAEMNNATAKAHHADLMNDREIDRWVNYWDKKEDRRTAKDFRDEMIAASYYGKLLDANVTMIEMQAKRGAMSVRAGQEETIQKQELKSRQEDLDHTATIRKPLNDRISEVEGAVPLEFDRQTYIDNLDTDTPLAGINSVNEKLKVHGLTHEDFTPQGRDRLLKKWESGEITQKTLIDALAIYSGTGPYVEKVGTGVTVKDTKTKKLGPRKALVPKSVEGKVEEYLEEGGKTLPNWMSSWWYNPSMKLLTEEYDVTMPDVENRKLQENIRKDIAELAKGKATIERWLPQQKAMQGGEEGIDIGQAATLLKNNYYERTGADRLRRLQEIMGMDPDASIEEIQENAEKRLLQLMETGTVMPTEGAQKVFDGKYKPRWDDMKASFHKTLKTAGRLDPLQGPSTTTPPGYINAAGPARQRLGYPSSDPYRLGGK